MPSDLVMHKFKHGDLHSGSKTGPKVKNRKQAIAIMLSEKKAEQANGGKYPEKRAMGGPMMGMAQCKLDVPIIKGTSGILALSAAEVNSGVEKPCIRCGRCVEACPMGLIPSMLSILGQRNLYQVAKEDYNLLDCVECGSCVYACPAKRNIVHYVKLSKAQNAAAAVKK